MRVITLEEGRWWDTDAMLARPREMTQRLYRDGGQIDVGPGGEPEAEEEFAWQGLANDTQDAAARGDTTPQQQDKPARPQVAAGEQ